MRAWLEGAVLAAVLCVCPDATAGPRRHPVMRMSATAYCDRGATRSGARAQTGVVAADPRQLPLGSRLQILGPGQPNPATYVVADTGSAIAGRDLDIFMPSCRRAKAFGKRTVFVRILKRGTGAKDARDAVSGRGGR